MFCLNRAIEMCREILRAYIYRVNQVDHHTGVNCRPVGRIGRLSPCYLGPANEFNVKLFRDYMTTMTK